MKTVQEYIKEHRTSGRYPVAVPHITCPDGFKVSVQASEYHYCSPRFNDGPWTHVELGYPSEYMGEDFDEYMQYQRRPTRTVYAQVPIWLVEELIEKHGGIKQS